MEDKEMDGDGDVRMDEWNDGVYGQQPMGLPVDSIDSIA